MALRFSLTLFVLIAYKDGEHDCLDAGGTSSGMSEGRTMQAQLSGATLGAKAEMPNPDVISCTFLNKDVAGGKAQPHRIRLS